MKHLRKSLILATATGFTWGISVFMPDSAQAVTLTAPLIQDTYVDSRSPNTNFGQATQLFEGRLNQPNNSPTQGVTGQQLIYGGVNLGGSLPSSLVPTDRIVAVRNVLAEYRFFTVPYTTFPPILNSNPGIVRIDVTGYGVNSFNENAITFNSRPPINTTASNILFTGTIAVNTANNAQPVLNIFRGAGLNTIVSNILTGNRAATDFYFGAIPTYRFPAGAAPFIPPFGALFSAEETNPALRPELRVTYDLWTDNGWETVTRAGALGDWQQAVSEEGTGGLPFPPRSQHQVVDFRWVNGRNNPFRIEWDGTVGRFIINPESGPSVTNPSRRRYDLDITPPDPLTNQLQGASAFCKSDTTDQAPPDTQIFFRVTSVVTNTGQTVNVNQTFSLSCQGTAVNPIDIRNMNFFFSDLGVGPLQAINGFIRMSWPPNSVNPQLNNARSDIQLQIKPIGRFIQPTVTTLSDEVEIQSVPEPTSVISLLVLGGLGTGMTLKRKLNRE